MESISSAVAVEGAGGSSVGGAVDIGGTASVGGGGDSFVVGAGTGFDVVVAVAVAAVAVATVASGEEASAVPRAGSASLAGHLVRRGRRRGACR